MDSKIILAILIVALIGIVAATYNNETGNVMNSLANVATEDSASSESVSDAVDANSAQNGEKSIQVDEQIVQPDSSVNSKVVSTQQSSNNNNNPQTTPSTSDSSSNPKPTQTSNPTAIQSTNSTSQSSDTATHPANSSSSETKISKSEAMSIAKNNLDNGLSSNYQKVTETTIDGKPYYEVNLYQDGEIIAYAEIDATNGRITGGATKGEAPEV